MKLSIPFKTGRDQLTPLGIYYLFTFGNTIAFSLLAGNIITLYALRLGADAGLIGILSSLKYMIYIMQVWSRNLVPRLGAVRQLGIFWFMRYMFIIPVALSALPQIRNNPSLLSTVLVLSVLGYFSSKGVATIAFKLIVAELVPRDMLGFVVNRSQTITSLVMILTGVMMGTLLSDDSPLSMYTLFFVSGILIGLFSATLAFRFPEPVLASHGYTEKFQVGWQNCWADRGLSSFLAVVILISFAMSMTSSFEILFFKQVYRQPDNMVMFLVVFGYLGGVVMSLISGRWIKRVGTRRLMQIFFMLYVVTIGLLIWSPQIDPPWLFFGGLAVVYFFMQVGISSQWTNFDIHFYSITEPEARLNLTVVYGLVQGISSIMGALAGGALLEYVPQWITISTLNGYRLLFGLGGLLAVAGILLTIRMPEDFNGCPE